MTIQVLPNVDSFWGEISVTFKNEVSQFPYDTRSGKIFNVDPINLIRLKSIALTFSTPFVSLIRCVYTLATYFFSIVSQIYSYLDQQHAYQNTTLSISDMVYDGCSESLRILRFGMLMTKWAFLGILDPYEGRLNYGLLEQELNRHTDGPHRNKFYHAICFQPKAILPKECKDEDLQKIESKLIRYLTLVDNLRSALFSCELRGFINELKLANAI
jgi:hypothetical protein